MVMVTMSIEKHQFSLTLHFFLKRGQGLTPAPREREDSSTWEFLSVQFQAIKNPPERVIGTTCGPANFYLSAQPPHYGEKYNKNCHKDATIKNGSHHHAILNDLTTHIVLVSPDTNGGRNWGKSWFFCSLSWQPVSILELFSFHIPCKPWDDPVS